MSEAVAYIRRSHKDAGGQVSREDQLATVRSLAEQHGETIGETYIDWGRSGGDADDEDALKHRPRFRALLRRIEAGEVSAVFALKIDRLGRSSSALGRLWAACKQNGTRVITTEGDFTDDDDPATFLMRHTFEGFAVYYLKDQKRKSAKTKAYTDERGDDYGRAPYGYVVRTPKRDGTERVVIEKVDVEGIQRVLNAYEEAGTFLGAAKMLNAAGVPTARPEEGSDVRWHASTVRRIVEREAPSMVSSVVRRGRRADGGRPRLFAGLLRCWCKTTLTPGGTATKPVYYCWRASASNDHAKASVSERKLRPWIEAEAAKLRLPSEVEVDAEQDTDDAADLAAIAALRAAGRDEMADDLARDLEARRSQSGQRARIVQAVPPALDWEWSTEAINEWLRAAFEYVQLGDDLMPTKAVWRVPEWRAA